MMLGQEPRQTTSNLGHLNKLSIQALIHGLNRHYYSIAINYRKNELEEKMLLNLHKKKWIDGLTLSRFDTHSKTNEQTVQFHSKSVATCHGRQIFENFRGITEDYWLRSSSSFFRRRYAHFTARIQVPHGNHISGQVRLTNTPSVEINGDHLLQEVTRSRRPVYDLDERNCLGMSNLGTSPATIDMKLLKLTWRRLEGLAARLGGAKNIFCELFSDNKAENTFWLDSSSIEKVCLEEEECTFQFGSLFMSFLWKM
ncbi:aminodeoxychorismate synthase, chloroplastic-like isoform X2 [Syzygium oleosum]|uniref:aminodeoxychorismate synthase, chloroplastic-like isoform X2 n=1 Tax=Syzygium oleosum TaxID=219896 RepID=UPI0011D2C48B|nr:aminodeoxychorismate synthase, chloroplastic-like isoform X2 [Syzygium oleosum]XP_056174898.1 aminodeoxychorismate synthase, chloroplastic-like isoform X2 [Syzygium oleosum]XP_056174899.1 aminodeoxychorismate synthase, chloroplastic-like isoform X2 [Syzygium oleosum]XP_056174900.1 aminodeoxychorismate synthase, chloroplastic-like isoform X2 [Syzygium oleosum]